MDADALHLSRSCSTLHIAAYKALGKGKYPILVRYAIYAVCIAFYGLHDCRGIDIHLMPLSVFGGVIRSPALALCRKDLLILIVLASKSISCMVRASSSPKRIPE